MPRGRPKGSKNKALVVASTEKERELIERIRAYEKDAQLLHAHNRVLKQSLKKAQWQASARGIMVAGLEQGIKQLRQRLEDSGEEVPLEVFLAVASKRPEPAKPRTQWRQVEDVDLDEEQDEDAAENLK